MNILKEKIDNLNQKELKAHVGVNKGLHQDIWNDKNNLKPEVKEKLEEIAQLFLDEMRIKEFEEFKIEDIIFTGSLANYTYTDYSDLDMHIIYSFDGNNEMEDIFNNLMLSKKVIWNFKNEISIKGFEVEIYTQKVDEEHISSGYYSVLNGKWEVYPTKREDLDIDMNKLYQKVEVFSNMIDKAIENKNEKELDKIFAKIKKIRKESLNEDGIYSIGNLAFKALRSLGKVKELVLAIKDIKTEKFSLDEKTAHQKKRGLKKQKILRNKLNNLEKKKQAKEDQKILKGRSKLKGALRQAEEDNYLDSLEIETEHETINPFTGINAPDEEALSMIGNTADQEEQIDDQEETQDNKTDTNDLEQSYVNIDNTIIGIVNTLKEIGASVLYRSEQEAKNQEHTPELDKDTELEEVLNGLLTKLIKVEEGFQSVKDFYKAFYDTVKINMEKDSVEKIKENILEFKFNKVINENVEDMFTKMPIFATTIKIIVDFIKDLWKLLLDIKKNASGRLSPDLLERLKRLIKELIEAIKRFNNLVKKEKAKEIQETLKQSEDYVKEFEELNTNLEKLINNSKASQKKDAELIKQNQKKDVYTNKEDQVQVDFKPKTKRSINKNY